MARARASSLDHLTHARPVVGISYPWPLCRLVVALVDLLDISFERIAPDRAIEPPGNDDAACSETRDVV